jgi:hypothetical protein
MGRRRRTIYAPCNYQLVLDNLMDLTHEEFIHSSSIGQDELSESDFVVTHDDYTVTAARWMLNIDAPPFWLKNMRDKFPGFEGKVDRWQIITYRSPFADPPGVAIQVPLTLTLPSLFVTLFSPLAGYVADRVGRKQLLVFAHAGLTSLSVRPALVRQHGIHCVVPGGRRNRRIRHHDPLHKTHH